MAFDRHYLTTVSGAGTPAQCRIFRYVSTDPIATVLASGYFDTGGDSEFNIGDLIITSIVDSLFNTVRTSSYTYNIEIVEV